MGETARQLATLAALPLLAGCCASFRAGKLQRIGAWPPGPPAEAEKLRSISVAFLGTTLEDGREISLHPRAQFLYRNATHWAYYWSGRFTHVRPAPALADLKLRVCLTEKRARSPLAIRIAHTLTLGLVPSWERREWTLVTTIGDQHDKELWRIEEAEAVNTWHQLLLILAFPFAPPPGVAANCVFDLNRASILQACRQGIF